MTDFPTIVDSTILSAFRACPRKAYLQYIEHWKPKHESVHLVAGRAFAAGIEAAREAYFREGRPTTESEAIGLQALVKDYGDFECPADSAKSLDRTMGALEYYFQQYPFGEDGMTPVEFPGGARGIEFSFAEPLPVSHPQNGNPILYTGRADMVAHFAGGVYVVDEKTTSALGPSWPRKWDMRGQFSGYCWACGEMGINPSGVIVRGVSILKTKYDTQQVISNRAPFEIDRWLQQTINDVARMVTCWNRDYFDYNLDDACTSYGSCPFSQVCKSPKPETWLNTYFERRVWDPLKREERVVE